jgi:flagellar motor switch protein FliN
MNTEQALLRLAVATADAAQAALEERHAGEVEGLGRRVSTSVPRALEGIATPAVAVSITQGDGGGALLVAPVAVARRLADGGGSGDTLTDDQLTLLAEQLAPVLRAVAEATSDALGQVVEAGAPAAVNAASEAELADAQPEGALATAADLTLFGEPVRLLHVLPPAFLAWVEDTLGVIPDDEQRRSLRDAMLDVDVRVWAELGRARMSSQKAVALPRGAVVELDREADDAIDLYVDGLHFGTGRLIVTDEGELALRLESVGLVEAPVDEASTPDLDEPPI